MSHPSLAMEFEEALALMDAAIFNQVSRHLSEPETTILRGAWQGQTYEEMAEQSSYSLNYLKGDVGPKLWKTLSEVLGEEVSKTKLRAVLARQRSLKQSLTSKSLGDLLEVKGQTPALPYRDWDIAPDILTFYGRKDELKTLEQWIIQEQCQLIAILGMGGMGKTSLAVQSARAIQDKFDYVIWRSLRYAPPLTEILHDLLKILAPFQADSIHQKTDYIISQLIQCLSQNRCLIIFDNFEAIMQSGVQIGRYQKNYENYGELLKRLAQKKHRSCLLINSIEKPREIMLLAGLQQTVRALLLEGLQLEDAFMLLKSKGLKDKDQWQFLVQLYRGNPLALETTTSILVDLFDGSINEDFKKTITLSPIFREVLAGNFNRLSNQEKQVLISLSQASHSLSIEELKVLLSFEFVSDLITILDSLTGRALIEKNKELVEGTAEVRYTVQPVVRKYMLKYLVSQ